MKNYLLAIISLFFISNSFAQAEKQDTAKVIQNLEVACGQCMFGMKDDDCILSVRIKGIAYHVEGADIDGFGDAHSKDGFCNAIREAAVSGRLEKNKFKVTSFKLLPLKQ